LHASAGAFASEAKASALAQMRRIQIAFDLGMIDCALDDGARGVQPEFGMTMDRALEPTRLVAEATGANRLARRDPSTYSCFLQYTNLLR
jgi:hypothetical protein